MSLTSKQRSKLKSIAANIQPVGQIGKEGIGENMLKSFSDCLDARELVKVSILENAEGDPQSLGRELAARLGVPMQGGPLTFLMAVKRGGTGAERTEAANLLEEYYNVVNRKEGAPAVRKLGWAKKK